MLQSVQQEAMRALESIVHPLVTAAREHFLRSLPAHQALVVFDIPLLYETGGRDTVRMRPAHVEPWIPKSPELQAAGTRYACATRM